MKSTMMDDIKMTKRPLKRGKCIVVFDRTIQTGKESYTTTQREWKGPKNVSFVMLLKAFMDESNRVKK